MTSRQYRPAPVPTIARSIPREPGRSDLYRTVVVRLATADYEATTALFGAVRATLEGTR